MDAADTSPGRRLRPEVHPSRRYLDEFEVTTRQLRWTVIVMVAVVFPVIWPRFSFVIVLVVLATIYNLSRYSRRLLDMSWFSSPLTIIIIDNLFIGALLAVVGSIDSAFSLLLIFMIVTAAYQFGLVGAVCIALGQCVWLGIIMAGQWLPALVLTPLRSISIIIVTLLGLGFLVDRLSRLDRIERQQLRKLSRRSETERSHLLALINSLHSAVFVIDADGKIVLHNEAATEMVGQVESLRGKDFGDVLPLYVRTDVKTRKLDILNGVSAPQRRRDLQFKTADGRPVDLDINLQPARLENTTDTNFIIVCDDITHERSLDEQRTEFIAVASHELRTPIAIMEASLSLALQSKEPMPTDTRALIEQAHDSTAYLAGIIKDLSTLSEASNDNLPVQFEVIDAHKLVHGLADSFKAQADQKGLDLVIGIKGPLPQVLSTERHIREILQNYLTNAVKYTPQGEITLKAGVAGNGGLLFSVSDTGIGISPADQKHLFTKFFRAEDYRTRSTGGTGLGLYLCQELAERIGAKVWCKSSPRKGSTFYLQVPPVSALHRDQGEVVKAQVANMVDGI